MADVSNVLSIRPAAECRYDVVSLGEEDDTGKTSIKRLSKPGRDCYDAPMESEPNGQSNLRAMHRGGNGVGTRHGENLFATTP